MSGVTRQRHVLGRRLIATVLGGIVAVGGLALVPSAQAAPVTVVSLTFNDAQTSQYRYARPLLNARGIDATFYAATGWVDAGSNGSVDTAQLRQLYREGHEIGGMGRDHKNLTDPATDLAYKTAQVCDDHARLVELGVDPQTFAYPGAGVNTAAKSIVQGCGYRAGRTVGQLSTTTAPYAETIPPADAYNVRTAFFPTGPVTLATLQASVTAASSHGGGWVPMVFNQVCHQGSSNYSTCMASAKPVDDVVLGQFLDWLATSGQTGGAPADVVVDTVRDVMGAPAPPPIVDDPTVVSLTFNDGLISQYNARPILSSHNVHGTFYVSSGFVDANAAGYMPSWLLDDLYRDGNEIGGGTTDHKDLTQTYSADPAQDLAYKTAQVCDDRTRLAALGYDPQSFAYPVGAYNATAKQIVDDCGYLSGRSIGKLGPVDAPAYAERIPPRDAMAVRTLDLLPGPVTLNWLKDSVLAAADNGGGWLPIGFNQVCSSADATYATCMNAPRPIDAQVLDAFLDWMDTSAPATTEVQTVRDVMGAPDQPNLPPRDTKVSLTFDDGLTSQYRIRTMLAGHDADGTFYINSGPVIAGEQGTMTWAQIRALESDGNEIGGHTVDHVSLTDTSTTYEYKRDQVCRDRATLLDQGFNPVSFAYPFASFNAEAQQIVQACGYQSGRTGGTLTPAGPHYSEDIPPKNAYAIRILGTTYNGPITLQSLQDAVNGAASHGGGWIPMLFHVICFEGDSTFDSCMAGYRTVSDTTLNQFLTWLDGQASNGISTATIGEVMGNTLPADTEAPTVSISDPTPDATVTTATPAIAGSAGTEPGDDSTADVEIFAGETVTGSPVQTLTADVGAGGDWSVGAAALANGTYTARASQGDAAGNTGTSDPVTFHVNGLNVTSVSPNQLGQGVVGRQLTINGSGFTSATTVAVSGTGVSLSAPVLVNASTITTTVDVAASATVGARTVSVNRAGVGASCAGCLTITGAPTATSLSPNSLGQGATAATVRLNGTRITAGAVVSFSGTGVSATVTTLRATSVDLSTTVAGNASVGARDVTVTNQDGGRTVCVGCFSVVAGPKVTSVSPQSLARGTTTVVTITGSGFTGSLAVNTSGGGLSLTKQTIVNATTIMVTVKVNNSAAAGLRDVTVVSNTNAGRDTLVGGLRIT